MRRSGIQGSSAARGKHLQVLRVLTFWCWSGSTGRKEEIPLESFSSTTGEAVAEATSPPRKNGGLIRKGEGVKQVYRKVGVLQWGSPMEILMQISRWRFAMQDR
jgi:hypothetical protein